MTAMSARVKFVIGILATACVLAGAPRLGEAQGGYRSIAVLLPADGETVFDNSGALVVDVAVSPALQATSGDQVRILIDGAAVAQEGRLSFQMSGVDRGSHTVEAQVVGKDGQVLITSAPVTFEMWQASKLFPSRKH